MKTLNISLYSIEELSNETQKSALNNYKKQMDVYLPQTAKWLYAS